MNTLLYAEQVWEQFYLEKLEKVQPQFYRGRFHLPRGTPEFVIRFEFSLLPVAILVLKIALIWLAKLLEMNDDRIPTLRFK